MAPDIKVVAELQQQLVSLQSIQPVPRGFAFEAFLSGLFELFNLAPRGSFRMRGEQIDGSFRLHAEIYLFEAKWRNEHAALADLLTFSGKVEGKAQWEPLSVTPGSRQMGSQPSRKDGGQT